MGSTVSDFARCSTAGKSASGGNTGAPGLLLRRLLTASGIRKGARNPIGQRTLYLRKKGQSPRVSSPQKKWLRR